MQKDSTYHTCFTKCATGIGWHKMIVRSLQKGNKCHIITCQGFLSLDKLIMIWFVLANGSAI